MIRSSFVRSLVGVFALLLVIALPVLAQGVNEPNGDNNDNNTPEFSLGPATAALTLLSGGLLVLRARKRRRAE